MNQGSDPTLDRALQAFLALQEENIAMSKEIVSLREQMASSQNGNDQTNARLTALETAMAEREARFRNVVMNGFGALEVSLTSMMTMFAQEQQNHLDEFRRTVSESLGDTTPVRTVEITEPKLRLVTPPVTESPRSPQPPAPLYQDRPVVAPPRPFVAAPMRPMPPPEPKRNRALETARVIVSPFANFTALVRFEASLKKVEAIRRFRSRNFRAGQFDMTFDYDADVSIVDTLLGLKTHKLELLRSSENSFVFRLIPDDAARSNA